MGGVVLREIRLRLWDRGLCGRRSGLDDKYVRLCVVRWMTRLREARNGVENEIRRRN